MKLDQEKLVSKRKRSYTDEKERIDKVIQESIFGILYVLLKDDEPNIYLFIFLSITEYLEFLQFPFNSSLLHYWDNNPIAQKIVNVVSYLDIVYYLENKEPTVYLLVYYFFVVLVSLVIVNIAYVSYSFSRRYFTHTWPLYVLSKTAKIFITILFIPIISLNLSIFVCVKNEKDGKYYNKTSPKLICFDGFYVIHMITSLIISVIFFIICIVVVINFFECSECEEDIEAK